MRYYKHALVLHKIISGTHYWFKYSTKEWVEDTRMKNRYNWKLIRKDHSFKWMKESDLMLELL